MAGRRSTLPEHDQATGGKLIPLLMEGRSQGLPYEDIAAQVRDLGVKVAATTVYRWCKSLADEPDKVAS